MLRPLTLCLLLLPALARAELEFTDAWIKHLPPTVPVRAGYLTIHNPDDAPRRIVALDSDSFARVEIHQSLMQDGMMRMEQLPEFAIEPGATIKLEPGGLHLMMMEPDAPTRLGQLHRVRIELDDGSTQQIEMTVKK